MFARRSGTSDAVSEQSCHCTFEPLRTNGIGSDNGCSEYPDTSTVSRAMLGLSEVFAAHSDPDGQRQWLLKCARFEKTEATGRSIVDTDNTRSTAFKGSPPATSETGSGPKRYTGGRRGGHEAGVAPARACRAPRDIIISQSANCISGGTKRQSESVLTRSKMVRWDGPPVVPSWCSRSTGKLQLANSLRSRPLVYS